MLLRTEVYPINCSFCSNCGWNEVLHQFGSLTQPLVLYVINVTLTLLPHKSVPALEQFLPPRSSVHT